MADIEGIEGPWIDADGNECLGIWADEGGVLLELQRTPYGGVSFYVLAGAPPHPPATVAAFRQERIREFLGTEPPADPSERA